MFRSRDSLELSIIVRPVLSFFFILNTSEGVIGSFSSEYVVGWFSSKDVGGLTSSMEPSGGAGGDVGAPSCRKVQSAPILLKRRAGGLLPMTRLRGRVEELKRT